MAREYEVRSFAGTVLDGTLASGINGSTETIPGSSEVETWPDGSLGAYFATIDRGNASEELVHVSTRSGTTLTVVPIVGRGGGEGSGQAHDAGATIEITSAPRDYREANEMVAGLNRWTAWVPTITAAPMTTVVSSNYPGDLGHRARYMRVGKLVTVQFAHIVTFGGSGSANVTVSLPVTAAYHRNSFAADIQNGAGRATSGGSLTSVLINRADGANLSTGPFWVAFSGSYEIA